MTTIQTCEVVDTPRGSNRGSARYLLNKRQNQASEPTPEFQGCSPNAKNKVVKAKTEMNLNLEKVVQPDFDTMNEILKKKVSFQKEIKLNHDSSHQTLDETETPLTGIRKKASQLKSM